MTDDDIRLAVKNLHDRILGWTYEVTQADVKEERKADVMASIADSLDRLPPGCHEEWADRVEEYRPYIDHAIALLRAAQQAVPTRAAAALRHHPEETA